MNTQKPLKASNVDTWSNCAGSVNFIRENNIVKIQSETAQDGERAHKFAEDVLLGKLKIDDPQYSKFHYVKLYTDFIDYNFPIENKSERKKNLEVSFDLTYVKARIDFIYFDHAEQTLHIADLKTGFHEVEAENNKQLILNAYLAFCELTKTESIVDRYNLKFKLYIIQPNLIGSEKIKVWNTNHEYINSYGDSLLRKAYEILWDLKTTKTLTPSIDACRYCDARGQCASRADDVIKTTSLTVNQMDLQNPRTITDEQIVLLLENKKQIEKTIEAVEEIALYKLLKGEEIKGLKLVEGKRPPLQWSDEELAEIELSKVIDHDDLYKKKLITPAQAKNLIAPEFYEHLTTRNDPSPKVALEREKGKEYRQLSYIDQFKKVEID